ncbi:MAG: hypothetical protein ABS44_21720 [Chryseobacterium sp. SCN 40-13]|nr:MAG: hypothetical protein ABS44_21720 [Chryseobacterium sp. SCN 40-13]
MKKLSLQLRELRRASNVLVNGRRYVAYHSFMWYCGLSSHSNQLTKKQEKYPSYFILVNDAPYVSEDYARYILQQQHAFKMQAALQKGGAL